MTEGPTDSTSRIKTWGYRPDGDAQIFDLAPGEGLPDSWHDSPACITDPALATADALSARLAENERTGGGPAAVSNRARSPALADVDALPKPPASPATADTTAPRSQAAQDLAAAIGATVLEGIHAEPLEYVLRRGYAAMGLPPALAAEMCRRLAALRIEEAHPAPPLAGPIAPEAPVVAIERPGVVTDDNPTGAALEQEPSAPAVPDAGSPDPGGGPTPVQIGQPARTREEAREAVRALLAEDLTDREIARRVGVSPSTVAAVRRAAQAEQGNADA